VLERFFRGLDRTPKESLDFVLPSPNPTSTLARRHSGWDKIKGPDGHGHLTTCLKLKGSSLRRVSVRQLLMMSSGVKVDEGLHGSQANVAPGAGLYRQRAKAMDPLVSVKMSHCRALPRRATEVAFDTGEKRTGRHLISNAVGEPLSQYLFREKVVDPPTAWRSFLFLFLLSSAGCRCGWGCIRGKQENVGRC